MNESNLMPDCIDDNEIKTIDQDNKPVEASMSIEELKKLRIVDLKKLLLERKMSTTGNKDFFVKQLEGIVFPNRSDIISNENTWSFYIISNGPFTYAGISPNPVQRLKAHNGEIANGARYTLSKGPGWKHICVVNGFNKTAALQFEWRHKSKDRLFKGNTSGIYNRVHKMIFTMKKTHYTSNSKLSSLCPLIIQYYHQINYDFLTDFPDHVTIKYHHPSTVHFNLNFSNNGST